MCHIQCRMECTSTMYKFLLTMFSGGILPITFILLQNLEMFLPPSVSNLNNASGASMVISSQVGLRDSVEQSEVLQENPISINFTFNAVSILYFCIAALVVVESINFVCLGSQLSP